MRKLLAALVILLALITLAGWIKGDGRDRMSLSVVQEKKLLTVVVTLPDASARYYWLQVDGCAAFLDENGTHCDLDGWAGSSGREISAIKQYLIPFRDAPGGTVRFMADVKDQQGKVLAADSVTILRGW